MKQYLICVNDEYSTKSLCIWADEYHEDQWHGLIFTLNNEIIAILDKDEFYVKE